jgi:adenosine deaminase
MKLITPIGEKPDLLIEIIDLFNNHSIKLHKEHATLRNELGKITQLFVITTTQTQKAFLKLKEIVDTDYPDIELSERHLGVEDIKTAQDEESTHKIIFEFFKSHGGTDLVISSGGRKQITQAMQEAAQIYGCRGYFSVTASRPGIRYQEVRKNPSLIYYKWYPTSRTLKEMYDQMDLNRDEWDELNFPALLRLPKMILERLKKEKIGQEKKREQEDLEWLQQLPKTDLHCHLGGCANPRELKRIAKAIIQEKMPDMQHREEMIKQLKKQLSATGEKLQKMLKEIVENQADHPLSALKKYYQTIIKRYWEESEEKVPLYLINACQIEILQEEEIHHLMYDPILSKPEGTGIDYYMSVGEFDGSTLLQSKVGIETALECLLESCQKEKIIYLELRISPLNYTQAGLTLFEVMEIILQKLALSPVQTNLIIMATRHKDRASIVKHISTAITYCRGLIRASWEKKGDDVLNLPQVSGVDLAGKEEGFEPALFSDLFQPLHYHFIKITIHAGETAESKNVWEALFLLHAKRIGHGLRLFKDQEMMDYLRDFNISLEMCPTSNAQVNHYRDYSKNEKEGDEYPLKIYLDKQINVSINTDNRGISATTLSREFLKAAQLTNGGLSKWEILQMLKNGIDSSFLPLDQKKELVLKARKLIIKLLLKEYL